MKKLLLVSLCFLLYSMQVLAQNRTVTGTVTAKEDGGPIPGVGVKIKGTTTGTTTGIDGKYSITVPSPNSVLVFSFVGYAPMEKVASSSTINAVLEISSKQLGEVLISTALGISREAKSLGYSVGVVKGDDLTKAREPNLLNSLAGKVAGVKITASSGSLGGGAKIVIRGATSLTADVQPIFVIDGLPVDNQSQLIAPASSSVPTGAGSVDVGNRAADIPEDDIESVTVLKGAAASALYGTRAKNGAVIITTKRGKKGSATIDFNSTARFDNVLLLPKFQNEYAQGTQGVYNILNTNGWGPKISDVQNRTFTNFLGQNVQLQAYPDNIKDFYKTGQTYINTLAMGGADETSDYRVTFNNIVQTGTVEKQELNKNSIAINAGKKLPYGFDIRTNVNYTRTVNVGMPVQSSNDPNVLGSAIYTIPRTVDIHQLRDNYIDATGQQITLTPSRAGNNPYWILNNNINSDLVNRMYGNVIFSFKPASWLTFSDNLGSDYYNEFRQNLTRPGTIGALTGNFYNVNLYNRVLNNDFIITTQNKLTKDLSLKVIAGYNVYDSYYQREGVYAETLTVDQLYNYANAGTTAPVNTSNRKRLQGVYADLGLSYKTWLFLNATGRNDWSSTLPVQNNSYFYPSVSSSFVFSDLLPANKWLSSGILRLSYANVGGDTSPYSLAFAYIPVSSISAQYSLGYTFPFNGDLAFSAPSQIPPLNTLKPQNQNTIEAGLNLKFLNNRISADVTYYNSNTTNQIIPLGIPNSTGFSSKLVNAGSLRNKGVEITLGGVPVKTKNFNWNIDVLWSKNIQTVSLPKELPIFTIASGWSSLLERAEDGGSFGIYGNAWTRDPNGNIVIDPTTGLRKTTANQRLGNVAPDWMGSVNNTITYKSFSLSFLIDIHKGGVIYSNTVSSLRTNGLSIETAANRGNIFIDKGVTQVGTTNAYVTNTVPVQSMQDYWSQYGSANTEAGIFDASFIKLREAVISYSVPDVFLKRHVKFFKAVSIGAEGRNIWIIQKNVPYIDPEVNFFGASSAGEGVEFNSQPATRTIGFNLKIKI